jgi:hypothetical protein
MADPLGRLSPSMATHHRQWRLLAPARIRNMLTCLRRRRILPKPRRRRGKPYVRPEVDRQLFVRAPSPPNHRHPAGGQGCAHHLHGHVERDVGVTGLIGRAVGGGVLHEDLEAVGASYRRSGREAPLQLARGESLPPAPPGRHIRRDRNLRRGIACNGHPRLRAIASADDVSSTLLMGQGPPATSRPRSSRMITVAAHILLG